MDDLYSTEEKNSMRVYLQRMEVRISTMHRIAGVFLNGAGLLILLPVLLRDAIKDINTVVMQKIIPLIDHLYSQSSRGIFSLNADAIATLTEIISLLFLFVPFLISVTIPLYALYLLFTDTVQFYFPGHHFSYPDDPFIPRFALPAIGYSTDESTKVKTDVMKLQYQKEYQNYLIPFATKHKAYFQELHAKSKQKILPPTRTIDQLKQRNILVQNPDPDMVDNAENLGTALSLVGFHENDLIQEVARTELNLARNALLLRRLVLRYMKALLLIIWTTLISFGIASVIININENLHIIILIIGYFVWSIIAPILTRRPIKWIWEMSDKNTNRDDVRIDAQLMEFEKRVEICSWIAIGSCSISFLTYLVHIFTF